MTIVIVRLGKVAVVVFTVFPMASAPVLDNVPVTARPVEEKAAIADAASCE